MSGWEFLAYWGMGTLWGQAVISLALLITSYRAYKKAREDR